jgi:hypothetical protein
MSASRLEHWQTSCQQAVFTDNFQITARIVCKCTRVSVFFSFFGLKSHDIDFLHRFWFESTPVPYILEPKIWTSQQCQHWYIYCHDSTCRFCGNDSEPQESGKGNPEQVTRQLHAVAHSNFKPSLRQLSERFPSLAASRSASIALIALLAMDRTDALLSCLRLKR